MPNQENRFGKEPTKWIIDPTTGESSVEFASEEPAYDNGYDTTGDWSIDFPRIVMSSQLYKDAYEYLSKDSQYGAIFLQRLKAIPYAYAGTNQNGWQKNFVEHFLGIASNYTKNLTESFNQAMDAIRSIVENYQSFINSLPETQRQQQADAGYNAAITGDALSASSMGSASGAGSAVGTGVTSASSSASTASTVVQGMSSLLSFILGVGEVGVAASEAATAAKNAETASRGMSINEAAAGDLGTLRSLATERNQKELSEVRAFNEALGKDYHLTQVNEVDPETGAPIAVARQVKGMEVLTEISRYHLGQKLADSYRANLRSNLDNSYADVVGIMENEYMLANLDSLTTESSFNRDFFSARSGATEGKNTTDLTTLLNNIRTTEYNINLLDEWVRGTQVDFMVDWSKRLSDDMTAAPFLLNALFNMPFDDTVWHSNKAMMIGRYSLDTLGDAGKIFSAFIGGLAKAGKFREPPKLAEHIHYRQ